MSEHDAFLRRIVSALDEVGIPYMIAGSLASSLHGVPRATHDIDIVIDPTPKQLDALVASLTDGLYVDRGAALEALRNRRMFNVIQSETGWKADFIIRKDRPFSVAEFARRDRIAAMGGDYVFTSREDTILAKLEWARASGSERQLGDAAGIARVHGDLDLAYLRTWAARLGVADLLATILG